MKYIIEQIILEKKLLLNEMVKNSLCEVSMDYGGYGTGFLCKIKYPNQFNEIIGLIFIADPSSVQSPSFAKNLQIYFFLAVPISCF